MVDRWFAAAVLIIACAEVALRTDLPSRPAALPQESITNAVRHARNATKVQVHIAAGRPSVRISVRDDGETTGAARGAGFGLVGMAERAALLGGTFEAGPLAQGGWEVAAVFPRDGRRP